MSGDVVVSFDLYRAPPPVFENVRIEFHDLHVLGFPATERGYQALRERCVDLHLSDCFTKALWGYEFRPPAVAYKRPIKISREALDLVCA